MMNKIISILLANSMIEYGRADSRSIPAFRKSRLESLWMNTVQYQLSDHEAAAASFTRKDW